MHLPNRFSAAEIDARKRRLLRIKLLSLSDRRFLAVRFAAKLVSDQRKASRILGSWFDADSTSNLRDSNEAALLALAGVARNMRAVAFLVNRYKITAAEIAAATIWHS